MRKETKSSEHELMCSADLATGYVRRMIEKETRGWGDQNNALHRLGNRYGLPFWSLHNIRIGRAKTVEAGLFDRIRAAYLDLCERQVRQLQHEIEIEKAKGGGDASFEDLAREAEELAARVAQASQGAKRRTT
jgi:hypothetical protein